MPVAVGGGLYGVHKVDEWKKQRKAKLAKASHMPSGVGAAAVSPVKTAGVGGSGVRGIGSILGRLSKFRRPFAKRSTMSL